MNICVFCSCSDCTEDLTEDIYELGLELGGAGNTLVFGAMSEGLMGAVASGFQDAGAQVIGVAPKVLTDAGRIVHDGCTRVIEAATLAERKSIMLDEADAVLVAPGGIGTLDEVFCVLAMVVAGEAQMPVVFYNRNGFYDGLLEELEHMEAAGFIRRPLNELITVANIREECIAAF